MLDPGADDDGAAMAMNLNLDSRGHLTAAGLAALAAAPMGRAPDDLAAHVASCVVCQDRVLAGSIEAGSLRRERRAAPPAWRIWAVLGAILIALLAMLTMLQRIR
jgi:hypothetical protein